MDKKRLAKEIILILAVSVGMAMIVNTFSPKGIAWIGQWDSSQGVIRAVSKNDAWADSSEIKDAILAKNIYDSGKALFVDARPSEDYADGHIPGAVSLPLGQFDQNIEDFIGRHAVDQPIVTYCSGRTCEDSHTLARQLKDVGFKDVMVFIDGFPGWQAMGYPVE